MVRQQANNQTLACIEKASGHMKTWTQEGRSEVTDREGKEGPTKKPTLEQTEGMELWASEETVPAKILRHDLF